MRHRLQPAQLGFREHEICGMFFPWMTVWSDGQRSPHGFTEALAPSNGGRVIAYCRYIIFLERGDGLRSAL